MYRATKLTPELHASIVKQFSYGLFAEHVAGLVGMTPRALDGWIVLGEDGLEPYAQLVLDIAAAVSAYALRHVGAITMAAAKPNASQGTWRASVWALQKRFPHLYGKGADARVEHEAIEQLMDSERKRVGSDVVRSPYKLDVEVLDS